MDEKEDIEINQCSRTSGNILRIYPSSHVDFLDCVNPPITYDELIHDFHSSIFDDFETSQQLEKHTNPVFDIIGNEIFDSEKCVICFENYTNILLGDCRHKCVCSDCADKLEDKKCPICRQLTTKFYLLSPLKKIEEKNPYNLDVLD
jgi:hypothetical protein